MPRSNFVTARCGKNDPLDIEANIRDGCFMALSEMANSANPEKVIDEMILSGLRGRGGAGFPCGLKWKLVRQQDADTKYLICNADEGEVGAFKDRYLIENDPYTLLEGILIGCHAIGSSTAIIYLRAEYHFLFEHLERAIAQMRSRALLGDVEIIIIEGAGAYICGEETALINSLQGCRGEPRHKPPFPVEQGLWGRPTVINNVETLMNVPVILNRGGKWFSQIGTEYSKGTKVLSVSGDIPRPGVYELEMGSPLEELVVDCAGGKDIGWVQVGGASGRVLPASKLDTELSYEGVLGSGSVVVFNRSRDVIDFALWTAEFLAEESCGRCTPCREGTKVLVEVLQRLAQGRGRLGDLELLESQSFVMEEASICGLGKTAPVPILDTMHWFREVYETRVRQSMYLRAHSADRRGED